MKRTRFLLFALLFCILGLCFSGIGITVQAADHVHCECGKASCTVSSHSTTTYSAFDTGITKTTGGNYYLSGNMTASSSLSIEGPVRLCLNGYTLSFGTNRIVVHNGGSLTICDCGSGGTIQNAGQSTIYLSEGDHDLTIYGGSIYCANDSAQAARAIHSCTNGDISIYGGAVTGDRCGIHVTGVGTLLIDGATITGKNSYGVEISCYNSSYDFDEVLVKRGSIIGNYTGIAVTGSYGDGKIAVSGGSVQSNASIPNSAYSCANYCGISVSKINHPGCTIEISGGSISGKYSGIYSSTTGGTVTISGGTVGSVNPYPEYGIYASGEDSVHLTGGTVYGEAGLKLEESASLRMTAGIVYGKLQGLIFYSDAYAYLQGGSIRTNYTLNQSSSVYGVGANKGTLNLMGTNIYSDGPCLNLHQTSYTANGTTTYSSPTVNIYSGIFSSVSSYALKVTGGTVAVSGGTYSGGKADVYYYQGAATAAAAPLSFTDYNGDALTFEVYNPAVGQYLAQNVSRDGLITLLSSNYVAAYDSISKTVQIAEPAPAGPTFAEAFPDPIFRTYVTDTVLTNNSEDKTDVAHMTDNQMAIIAECDVVSVPDKAIASLEGIELFTGMTSLNCGNNDLTELDVSKNTALETLNCESNALTRLDLSTNAALKHLTCNNNLMTELDVSKNTALTSLSCDSNGLTELDISKNTALTSLSCNSNALTVLDIRNHMLYELSCSDNYLIELDVAQHTELNYLACDNNCLIILDLRNNPYLSDGDNCIITPQYSAWNFIVTIHGDVWTVDMTAYISENNLRYVTMFEGGALENGIVTYATKPESVRYVYDTGKGEMEVKCFPDFSQPHTQSYRCSWDKDVLVCTCVCGTQIEPLTLSSNDGTLMVIGTVPDSIQLYAAAYSGEGEKMIDVLRITGTQAITYSPDTIFRVFLLDANYRPLAEVRVLGR